MKLNAPTLREYQKTALTKMSQAIKQGFNPIILKAPTGAGKTVIASHIIYNCFVGGKKAMMICDRIELINQTSDTLLRYGIDHGVIQAEHLRSDPRKKIQVASVQTLGRRNFTVVDVLLIDEAHTLHRTHIRYIEWLLKMNPKAVIVGLTATPFTRGLGRIFKKCVPVATTKELIDLGFLCKPVVYAPSAPDLEKIRVVAGDYVQDELEKATNTPKLVGDIAEHWIKIAYDKPTICFSTSINHSKAIVDEFKRRGINAYHIDAYTDDDERKKVITAFKNGAIKVLSSVDILSKGFDYPGAEVAILARPTKSLSLYIQQGGRVLRISPETGKKGCIILDHAGNTERHGFLTDDTPEDLDMGNKKEAVAAKCKKEKPAPTPCPSCSFVKVTKICDNCGFEHKPKNTVESADGYLVKISEEDTKEKKKTVKEMLVDNPIYLYGQLKQHCLNKGWKVGRAYFIFKDMVGDEPPKVAPLYPVTEQLASYIKHMQIKKAYSKNRYAK